MSKREKSTNGKVKPLDRCNIVYLAGTIKKISVRDEDAFVLLDVGPEKKYIPCTVYKDDKLIAILEKFNEEDDIKVTGYVRPWSQKQDGGWKNNMDVRITEVKTEPPHRERSRNDDRPHDDDIPF